MDELNACEKCEHRGEFFNISFKAARKRMTRGLKEKGLRDAYANNIAYCIYLGRRQDGRLNRDNCLDVAEDIIKLIWE